MRIKIILIISLIALLFSIYSTIGYFVLASKSGIIIGNEKQYFMGNIILGIVFLIISIILSIVIVLINKKRKMTK